jgi:hypothetical protein
VQDQLPHLPDSGECLCLIIMTDSPTARVCGTARGHRVRQEAREIQVRMVLSVTTYSCRS